MGLDLAPQIIPPQNESNHHDFGSLSLHINPSLETCQQSTICHLTSSRVYQFLIQKRAC